MGVRDPLDRVRSHERGPRVVLRSKSLDGVLQEICGYLYTHNQIRALICEVAGRRPLPRPPQLARSLPGTATRPFRDRREHTGTNDALSAGIDEITRELLPKRPLPAATRW